MSSSKRDAGLPQREAKVTVAPIFQARLCGIPFSEVRSLRSERLKRVARETLALQREIAGQGRRLADDIRSLVPEAASKEQRRLLLALRRDLYNSRLPLGRAAERSWLQPSAIADEINNWIERRGRLESEARFLSTLFVDESRYALCRIKKICRDVHFQRAVAFASRSLTNELVHWLDSDDGDEPPPRFILSVHRYSYRMATKTSPFSWFTLTSTGAFVDDGRPLSASAFEQSANNVPELTWPGVSWIAERLAQTMLAEHVLTKINPSLMERSDSCSYIQEPGSRVITIKKGAALDQVLRLLDGRMDVSLARLHAYVAERWESGERGSLFVERLIESGLLELHPVTQKVGVDGVRDLISRLPPGDNSQLLRHLMEDLCSLVEQLPEVNGHLVRGNLEQISRIADSIGTALGSDAESHASDRHVYENVVLPDGVETCSWPTDAQIHGLRDARDAFCLFNNQPMLRSAAFDYFMERWGSQTEVSYLAFYEAFLSNREAFLSAMSKKPRPSRQSAEEQSEIITTRHEFLDESWNREKDGSVIWTSQSLARVIEPALHLIEPPTSVDYFVQQSLPHFPLVINAALSGYQRVFSRQAHVSASSSSRDLATPINWELAPLPSEFAELDGDFGYTLNHRHGPLTSRRIASPGSGASISTAPAVLLSNLRVRVNRARRTLELFDPRDGQRIVPLHLGMSAEGVLPLNVRFLIRIFGPASSLYHSTRPILTRTSPSSVKNVKAIPRLVFGTVLAQRRSWIVPSRLVPGHDKVRRPEGAILDLVGWLEDQGIPDHFFIRRLAPGEVRSSALDLSHKPNYVDVFDPWSLRDFLRIAERSSTLLIQECVPDPRETSGAVRERVIELNWVDGDDRIAEWTG